MSSARVGRLFSSKGSMHPLVIGGLLALILCIGFLLRYQRLESLYSGEIRIGGAASEHLALAEYFLAPQPYPPPGNMPGFALFLAPLFAAFPFSHDAIQVWTTTILSLGVVVLCFFLGRQFLDPPAALLFALLISVNRYMVANAPSGMPEEYFLVSAFVFFFWYLRIRRRTPVSMAGYWVLGALAAWVTSIRVDAALIIIPVLVDSLLREKRVCGWFRGAVKVLPLIILPCLLILGNGWYQDQQGIKDPVWRAGRGFFWQEFLRGRMPWEYMFYARLSVSDWWFGYHDVGQMVSIVVRSSLRTLLAFGEACWGQLLLLVGLFGIWRYSCEERDWVLPAVVPLAVFPQWFWVYLQTDDDLFRYLLRGLPFLMLFVVYGGKRIWKFAQERWGASGSQVRFIQGGMVAAALVYAIIPGSVYRTLLTYTSPAVRLQQQKVGREVHPALISLWNDGFKKGKLAPGQVKERLAELIDKHPDYGPTLLAAGVVYLHFDGPQAAISYLEKSLEAVPFYAEAGILLAEVYALRGDYDRAIRTAIQMGQSRPGFTASALLRGKLYCLVGDWPAAIADLEAYLQSNRQTYQEAFEREKRLNIRWGNEGQVQKIVGQMRKLADPRAGLVTPFLWQFLCYDTKGIYLPVPFDKDVYNLLGFLHAQSGDGEQAVKNWETAVDISPDLVAAWNNLGIYYAQNGEYARAERVMEAGLRHNPGSIETLGNWGIISMIQEKWAEAGDTFSQILESDPGNAGAREMLNSISQSREESLAMAWRKLNFVTSPIVLPITRKVLVPGSGSQPTQEMQ